mgnify:CR=1 FL=1
MSAPATILLVEDEPLILLVAQTALEDAEFEVIVATNGDQAITALRSDGRPIKALVTDVRLGAGLDGWDVARAARRAQPRLPVIYATGDSAYLWPVHGVPNSIVVQKPYTTAQIVGALTGLLHAIDLDTDLCGSAAQSAQS